MARNTDVALPQPGSRAAAQPPSAIDANFDNALSAVERGLAVLGAALRERDATAIERHAAELHASLTTALQRAGATSRRPAGLPPSQRQRLALAGSQVAAQRESLARATTALDRAIGVLMPAPQPPAVYGTGGQNPRAASSGCLHA